MKTNILTVIIILCFANVSVAQKYKFGKVSKAELIEKEHATDPEANAAVLYREIKTSFDYNSGEGFYLTTDVFERIKIYNKEGFEWATQEIDLYQSTSGPSDDVAGLKGYTYYLDNDGKMQEVKLKNDGVFDVVANKYLRKTKFTMPGLREGCVIEFKYTVKSPFIGNIDEFKFQETIPVDKVSVRFSAPEYFYFQTYQNGWIPYNIEKGSKERRIILGMEGKFTGSGIRTNRKVKTKEITFQENIFNIDIENVPALKEEAYAGNINNYATSIRFELSYTDFPGSTMDVYSTTWEAVSKTTYNNLEDDLDRKGYFESELATATKDAKTQDEKILAIYNFVKNKMNWNGNGGYYSRDGVKDAYKKEVGNAADINLMLIGMLRQAGLNANPVLLSTKTHGIPLFPTRNGFNYVIAAVERSNDVVLLDATDKNAAIGILNPQLINWQGRLIRKDRSSDWVPLTPSAPATQSSLVNIDFKDDFSISGNSQNRFTGHYAWKYRKNYTDLNADSARKELEKEMPQTELSEVSFENLEKSQQPVTLIYNFEAFDMAEDVSGKIYFSPMVFLSEKENPFKLEERLYPVDFSYARKDRYIVTINIPEGYSVASLPENAVFNLGENTGSFRYLISQAGNKVQLSVEFAINKAYITADEYTDLKKFYELLIAKEQEKVVLSKA